MPEVYQEIQSTMDWIQMARFNELEREKIPAVESENFEKAIEIRDKMLDLKLSSAIDQSGLSSYFAKFQDFISLAKELLTDSKIHITLSSITCADSAHEFEQRLTKIIAMEFVSESDLRNCSQTIEEVIGQFKASLASFSSASCLPLILTCQQSKKVFAFVQSSLREAETKFQIFRTFGTTEQALIIKADRFLNFIDHIAILLELADCYCHALAEFKHDGSPNGELRKELIELTHRVNGLHMTIIDSCGVSLRPGNSDFTSHKRVDQALLNACRISGFFVCSRGHHAVCEYCGQFIASSDQQKKVNPCANLFARSLNT